MEERDYWLGFSVFPGVGPKKFALLLQAFDTAENAWNSQEKNLKKVLGNALTKQFLEFRSTFLFDRYAAELEGKSVWFVTLREKEYPKLLLEIDNPPFVLFGKGNKKVLNNNLFAVVGTRRVTSYGRQVTEMMTEQLVDSGFVIVSGLALGVDALAHQATIENKGVTIAVLGCGVDCCYPSTNEIIYNNILAHNGAVISEFPIGMKPSPGSFPSRNRIIAGSSQAVIVTEGAEDSGSLITAEYGLKYGRKVFAIPGPITSPLSNGPMKLIRKGAVLITSAEDILKEFQISNTKYPVSNKKDIKGETKEEQKIIDLLQNEPLSADEIIKKTKIPSSELSILLSMMELRGFLTSENGKYTVQN